MGRMLCAWSPSWAIANWRRRNPSASPAEGAFALVETVRGVRRLAAVDAVAAGLGLKPGQKAADAAALVPDLAVADAEPAADAAALQALVEWCVRFSPAVAADPPDGLILDIEGLAHLWGGEQALAVDLRRRAAQAGLPLRVAVADTAGAAWGLTRFAGDGVIAPPGGQAALLAPLPPAALRLEPETAAQLERLGLRRVEQLFDLPRAPFARRFGPAPLTRLDQALGRVEEALAFRRPPTPWFARLAFAEPISQPEDLARVTADVAVRLCERLEAAGQGARRFELAFHRLDGRAQPVEAGLSLAARDPVRLARLLVPRLETVDPGFGIETVTLAAREVEPLVPRQPRLAMQASAPSVSALARRSTSPVLSRSGEERRATVAPPPAGELSAKLTEGAPGMDAADEAESLAPLVDRLVNRLGEDRVWTAAPRASHVPELAEGRALTLQALAGDWRVDAPRPLRLFRRPQPIEAMAPVPDDPPVQFRWQGRLHRVRRAEGPERIAEEWWKRPLDEASPDHVRDYYRLEDQDGARFWVFRAGLYGSAPLAKWWLHGLFG